jgi:raffinose/stachyose/melibiose transport system permease protein
MSGSLEKTATTSPKKSGLNRGPGRKPGASALKHKSLVVHGSWWWAFPGLAAVIAVHYIATFLGAGYAFTDFTGIGDANLVGLDNFGRILQDYEVLASLGNTAFLAIGYLVLTNVIGLLLALALNRGLKSRYLLRTLLFLPVVLSSISVSYIFKYIFAVDGALNNILVALGFEDLQRIWLAEPESALIAVLIVAVWQHTGMAMVIYLAGLALVPQELEEAAALDGAGIWKRFRHITLPMIQPAIAINTTLALTSGLKIFDQVKAMTNGGPFGATDTLSTVIYRNTFEFMDYGYGAAISLVFSVVIFVAAAIQLYLTRDRGVNN